MTTIEEPILGEGWEYGFEVSHIKFYFFQGKYETAVFAYDSLMGDKFQFYVIGKEESNTNLNLCYTTEQLRQNIKELLAEYI